MMNFASYIVTVNASSNKVAVIRKAIEACGLSVLDLNGVKAVGDGGIGEEGAGAVVAPSGGAESGGGGETGVVCGADAASGGDTGGEGREEGVGDAVHR